MKRFHTKSILIDQKELNVTGEKLYFDGDALATESLLNTTSGDLQTQITDNTNNLFSTGQNLEQQIASVSGDIAGGVVHLTGAETISGVKTFADNMILQGNLTVEGTTTTVDSENVSIKDNIILINSGEVGAGVTLGEAGIEVDRGSEANYKFIFDETSDSFRIGETGSLQKVATREDAPNSDALAFWNNSSSRFDTNADITVAGLTGKLQTIDADITNFSGTFDASGTYTQGELDSLATNLAQTGSDLDAKITSLSGTFTQSTDATQFAIPQDVGQINVVFNDTFASTPIITATLQSDVHQDFYSVLVTNASTTGYTAVFSNNITGTSMFLNSIIHE